MKTILSFLLLPILVFAQPLGQYQKEGRNNLFSTGLAIESVLKTEIDDLESLDGSIQLYLPVAIYTDPLKADLLIPYFTDHTEVESKPPQYMSSFSIAGLFGILQDNSWGQERLDLLLSLNDPQFPKEDTLLDWLHPVRYHQNGFGGEESIAEGFGPRIRI